MRIYRLVYRARAHARTHAHTHTKRVPGEGFSREAEHFEWRLEGARRELLEEPSQHTRSQIPCTLPPPVWGAEFGFTRH